jgi:TRAP-type transport system periplasmic protein
MKKSKLVSLTVLFLVALSFIVSSAFAQIKLNYSIFFPAPHKNSVLAKEWGEEVAKRTNGKVQVTMFYGGTLTPADKCYDGVVKGISDIGMSVPSYTMGKFPLSEVVDLPLGSKTAAIATRLVNDYYNKFKPKEFDEVKILYFHAHGPAFIHTKTPVSKLEDLKGMKIRGTGTTTKVVAGLGATPVAMPMGDSYDAISRGVVEGIVCPMEALQGWKLGEVIKSTTQAYSASYNMLFFVAMNKAKWNALPSDIQKTIEQINEEWIEKHGKGWDEIDKGGTEFTLKLGNKIIPVSAEENAKWAKALQPMFDEYVREKKAKGLPAEDALKFVRERLKQLQP